jgi:hypothetical protein
MMSTKLEAPVPERNMSAVDEALLEIVEVVPREGSFVRATHTMSLPKTRVKRAVSELNDIPDIDPVPGVRLVQTTGWQRQLSEPQLALQQLLRLVQTGRRSIDVRLLQIGSILVIVDVEAVLGKVRNALRFTANRTHLEDL